MTIYNENSATRLTTGATDADSDDITVRRINGTLPNEFPATVMVAGRTLRVYEDGRVDYDDQGDPSDHPADEQTETIGTFTYTLWDGRDESNTATATVRFTGVEIEVDPGTEVSGYTAKWTATGVTGATLVDEVSGAVLAAEGAPTTGPSPAGADWLGFESGAAYYAAAAPAALPTGNSARTVIFCARAAPQTGAAAFGGFTYGANVTGGSFGFLINGGSHTVDLNLVGEFWTGPSVNDGEPFIATATYDGAGTLRFYVGKILIAEETEYGLDTAAGSVRLMRNMGGSQAREGNVGAVYVYDRALNVSEVHQMADYLNERYIADLIPPLLTQPSITPTSPTVATATVTASKTAEVWMVLSASATPPSAAQIKAGQDHTGAAVPAASGDADFGGGTVTRTFTDLTPAASYYLHAYAEGAAPDGSAVVTSSASQQPGWTAPSAITPTAVFFSEADPIGTSRAFTADQPDVTWSFVGTAPTGFAWDGNRLTTTAVLTAATTSFTVRATNLGGSTDQVVGLTITEAGVAPEADIETTWSGLVTLLNSWGGTVPAGVDVIEITAPHSGNINLSDVVLNRPVTIRGKGPFTSGVNADQTYWWSNSSKLSGTLNVSRAKGLRFVNHHIFNGSSCVRAVGETDVHIISTAMEATFISPSTPAEVNAGSQQVCILGANTTENTGVSGIKFINCTFQFAQTAVVYWRSPGPGCLMDGCVILWPRHDFMKVVGATNGTLELKNNWFGRDWNQSYNPTTDDWAHCDYHQAQTAHFSDAYYHGNVIWTGLNSSNGRFNLQGFYFGNGSTMDGVRIENNIICTAHINAIRAAGTEIIDHKVIENSIFRVKVTASGENQTGTSPQGMSYTQAAGNFGAGPNHTSGWVGTGGYFLVNQTQGGGAAGSPNDFDFDRLMSDAGMKGIPETEAYDFDVFRPLSSASRLHWDNVNPAGAYRRLKGIFEDHVHPQDWPTVAPWKHQFDRSNLIWPEVVGYGPQGEGITA